MAGRTRVVRFDDWSGGEFGDLGASAAPPKSFTGKNVIRYTNGLLGPRPGLIDLGVTGVPVGVVWGLRGTGTQSRGIVFGTGTTVYGFTYGIASAATSLGTTSATPTGVAQIVQYGADAYLTIQGDDAYKIDPAAISVTKYASSPGGGAICIYGERLFVANVAANPNRVYYSDANDYTTWPALSNFDVGSNDFGVSFIEETRNRLSIANAGGEWWILSGTVDVNATLRRSPREDVAPAAWNNCARLGEKLLFVPTSDDFPVSFSGAISEKLRYQHLEFTSDSGNDVTVAASPGQDVVAFVENAAANVARMLLNYQQTYTYHTMGVACSKLVTPVSAGGINTKSNPLIFCDGGAVGTAAKFYAFAPFLDRPGKTSDTNAQPGDASTTPLDAYVYTPEWWSPNGEEVTVRAVRVDFAKWNTGSSSTNHWDLNVRSMHRYGQDGTKDSATFTFDELASETSSDATLDSRTARFGDQGTGHGFQLRFTNLRGCAIDRIIVELDLDPARH